jgi:hypothetical protein
MAVQIRVSKDGQFVGESIKGAPAIDEDVTPATSPSWSAAFPVLTNSGQERLVEFIVDEDVEIAVVRGNRSVNTVTPIRLILPVAGTMIHTLLLSLPGETTTWNFYFRTP